MSTIVQQKTNNPSVSEVQNTTPIQKSTGQSVNYVLIALFLAFVLLIVLGLLYFFIFSKSSGKGLDSNLPTNTSSNQSQGQQSTPTSTLTPTPTRIPLAQGSQTYKIGDIGNGINILSAWFSTIDPGNETQQIKLTVTDKSAKIVSVTARVKTDKLDTTYPLTLSSGDGSSGDWSGSWTIKGDTYNENFQVFLSLKDDSNKISTTIITIR